ncbi:MAG TPA: MG2 domain-containing protein, partial [Fimbriimonadaceae bacterium]|nr:MG2 domain-containing protein [Fimbriimonadaceae bacterium]
MKRLASILPLVAGLLLMCGYLAAGVSHENPIGAIEGVLVMTDNGKPLPHAQVDLYPNKWDSGLPERHAESDSNGHFHIRAVAVGAYRVYARSFAHRAEESVDVSEGRPQKLNLNMDPVGDFVHLRAKQHVFYPGETTTMSLSGFVPAKTLSVTITRLNPDRVAQAGGLEATFEPLNSDDRHLGPDKFGEAVQTTTEELRTDIEGAFIQKVPIPVLPEGIYWVEADAADLHSGSYLNVTHMALVTKYAPKKLLTYTVDIKSGKPVPGAAIYANTSGKLTQVGTSGADGLAEADARPSEKTVVMAKLGDSLAVCERLYENWEGKTGPNTIFLYTDRSVYRPGDQIQFKGLVRRQDGTNYTLPKPEPVEVTLKDDRNNDLTTLHLVVSPRGAFHGAFTTSKEARPGDFGIDAVSKSGSGHTYVPVMEYRKPDYTITVLSGKPYYMLGEKASATITCEYYYGGPVVGAKVKASIFRSPDWLSESDAEETTGQADTQGGYEDTFQGGEYNQEVEVVTDATGKATIEFPTRADDDPNQFDSDYVYTVNASVADAGDRYFTGTGTVKVARGDTRLDVDTDHYVASPGDVINLTVKTSENPKSSIPAAGRTVNVEVGTDDWYGKERTFTLTQKLTLVTGPDGTAKTPIAFSNKGSVRIKATTVDAGGRTIHAEAFIYVAGDYGREDEADTLTAKLDKKSYSVGETAKVLIHTSLPGGSALMTIQSDGILEKRIVPLDRRSTLIQVPVDVRMTPNAYVSVAYVRNEKFLETGDELSVDRVDRDLDITVTPDRPLAKPGETVTFDVETKDPSGKPVAADASLAVVDEAIYAIRKAHIDIKDGFYPTRPDNVRTSYSFPQIYLDGGDKGSGTMRIRSRFLDTAAWVPDVQTGADGHATVRVKLPDNLTRWRATAVGCTADGTVGQSDDDVTARKELMVIVHSPGYLTSGDKQNMALTVENDTGHDADVSLKLATSGLAVTAPPATLHVANGKQESVNLEVTAQASGTATITAQAALPNGTGDAVRMEVPVKPHAEDDFQSRSGDTDGTATLNFTRSAEIDPAASRLRLTLSPSLATALLRPMGALVDYPYGCVEQTMSRFVPSVLVTKAFKDNGLAPPLRAAELPQIAADTFTRLNRLQHYDGGWGWWEYDASTASMTCLVLDGLKQAKDAGYPAPKWVDTKRAVDWLVRDLALTKDRIDEGDVEHAVEAYVFAEYGQTELAKIALGLAEKAAPLPTNLAYCAMARKALGLSPDLALSRLRRSAITEARGVKFNNCPVCEWGDEATGIVLLTFARLAPDDPLIPSIVHYLLASQRGEYWYSTRDSAEIVKAVSLVL